MRQVLLTRVRAVADVNAHMREIELAGPDVPRLRPRPGAHLVVHVPDGDAVARRVYSIWRHDPRDASLTLRVAVHPAGGPGCAWARAVAAGDRITVEPPRSKITLAEQAAFHLFAGDETGAVPLLAMRAALPRAAPVAGVFASIGGDDEMPGFDGVPTLPWVHRGATSAVGSRTLLRAVQELELPQGAGVAYLAGESDTCRLIQRHLIEQRGWPRRSVLTQPQWTPDRPGFGAGPA
ncbi:NADPH-dependent ferric siderophore reductase [Actinoplanes lutulentus]|uniref:NADPH-dependent ferric siderophore reductase n=1 Tax=Actinoplanes lutulentus TaxID=1287878 RepID=A0A327Z9F0_9ACTN|nr:siderophore-interacting protein [Actinoplanes lutulentus]MBB2946743.1 NADPH-dependent ferric siderophore reductase [Actinoplanes lutulentus]RAK35635.1 NADPH-dependent ferric siderophore reductase [Actinoplanes lutulentus]